MTDDEVLAAINAYLEAYLEAHYNEVLKTLREESDDE